MDTKYFILIDSILTEVKEERYQEWYKEKGRYLQCKSFDPGFCDNVFGGYNGVKRGDNPDWAPFYLTHSFNTEEFKGSKTTYYDDFSELCSAYLDYVTMDTSEYDFPIVKGPFVPDIKIADVNNNLMFGE